MNPKCLGALLLSIIVYGCFYSGPTTAGKKTDNHSITILPTRVDTILHHLNNPDKNNVLVVSHRGDWRYAPENSLMAIQRCIDLGVDIVEIDVRLTKDSQLVAMHDLTVDRTTNGHGLLSDLSLSEVKTLRLKNGCGVRHSLQSVPTLKEVMLLAKDKIVVNLDKTEGKTLREAWVVLKETGTQHQAILKGNDPLSVMRSKYGDLLDSVIYMPKVWFDTNPPHEYVEDYIDALHPPVFEMLFDIADSPVLQIAKTLNEKGSAFMAIALWDDLCAGHTDEVALLRGPDVSWGWLVKNKANAIMTDRPEELLKYLRENGLHR